MVAFHWHIHGKAGGQAHLGPVVKAGARGRGRGQQCDEERANGSPEHEVTRNVKCRSPGGRLTLLQGEGIFQQARENAGVGASAPSLRRGTLKKKRPGERATPAFSCASERVQY